MDFVDNQLDVGTGTMVGRALLPNPDFILTPGLFARLQLPGSGKRNAILLPTPQFFSIRR
jgi:multidrug efflux pump subunit AcrA (membrane-fusion protein)